MSKLKIEWQDFTMDGVVSHFMKDMKLKNKAEVIKNYDWFYDLEKKRLIIRLYVGDKEPTEQS